jgi:hypothetical protein
MILSIKTVSIIEECCYAGCHKSSFMLSVIMVNVCYFGGCRYSECRSPFPVNRVGRREGKLKSPIVSS